MFELYIAVNNSIVLNCIYDKFEDYDLAFYGLYLHLKSSTFEGSCEYRIIQRTNGKLKVVYKRVFTDADVRYYRNLNLSATYSWCKYYLRVGGICI